MAEIISISNQKGGCGKTTTAVNLTAALAMLGKKVLLVDMDPQGNASLTFGINIEDIPLSMAEVLLEPNVELKYNIFTKGNIHIAPSNPNLNYAEERLHTMTNKASRLSEKLGAVTSNYDYIIIDCPPSIGLLTTNALMASRWVIIPVDVGFYSLIGIKQILARVEDARASATSKNSGPEIMGLVVTFYNERNVLSREVLAKLKDAYGKKVFKSSIRRDIKLTEAPGHANCAFEYKLGNGAADYLALAKEVTRRR